MGGGKLRWWGYTAQSGLLLITMEDAHESPEVASCAGHTELDVRVLVVNAGSSSLKVGVLDSDDDVLFSADLPSIDEGSGRDAIVDALSEVEGIDAVGHRIVHGGAHFSGSRLVDDDVVRELKKLTDLAPLHQPPSLAALDAVSRAMPDVPAVVCFDTAFHTSLPPAAATYAVPASWRDELGIRRFGFHGLSHAYATRRAAEMLGRPPDGVRMVTCHLGAGASLAAVRDGASVDTTMGFTPLEGLVMATRSGSVDPGLLLWLQRSAGLSVEEIADALEHHSGLKGLVGTSDMRAVLGAAGAGEAKARLAVEVYVHRLVASVAAMAAALDGLDVLVFTGGVGENAWMIRQHAADRLGFLRVEIDRERNRSAAPDADVGSAGAAVRCLVIKSREDLEIARDVRELVGGIA
jgi:acetate kinase